ncbi:MAG: cyclic lactone autoinducer peptide [Oscillospiraceae bacterium]|nr:cyclic lactone autoinducer peptide [Oscillospiraceae bacterium]
MKSSVTKISSAVASLARAVAVSGAAQTCMWLYHQPKAPKSLDKYRR